MRNSQVKKQDFVGNVEDQITLPGMTSAKEQYTSSRASAGLEKDFKAMSKTVKEKLEIAAKTDADESFELEGSWQDFNGVRWSVNHAKLLYIISLYAVPAQSVSEQENWIRHIPLLVLMYEGIISGVLDFDYAPQSVLVSKDGISRRCFMNITQEGKGAIEDLREKNLLHGLKLSSEDFQPVTAYQCTGQGLELVSRIPKHVKKDVDRWIYAPKPYQDNVLKVSLKRTQSEEGTDLQTFLLIAEGGYEKPSTVTNVEEVSYVSSPYLPLHLRKSEKPMTNNSSRASEAAAGLSNIRDELQENIHLAHVQVLIGEWCPFGSNQIVSLNERLGAMDRCQGGLFTSKIDHEPTGTQLKVPTGLTKVDVLDFDLVHCINIEAVVSYPEDEGIVQIENFGMHLNVDGTVVYGMKIEAIMERKADDISLDMLSRLLVGVQNDSSTIMNDLASSYQRSILQMIYCGDQMNRSKYSMIIAEAIDPKLNCEEYMDRGDNENEIKQVLGDIYSAHNIGADDVLILGRDGMLFAGPNSRKHEPMLQFYLSLFVREIFVRVFFVRTFVLDDLLKKTRILIVQHERDPNNIPKIRSMLNTASKDMILLQEVLTYLSESLQGMEVPERPQDEAGGTLFKVLNLLNVKRDVSLRVEDLKKLVEGAHHELTNLAAMTDVINTKQLEDVFKNVESNTKFLVDSSASNERASASLEVIQIILGGMFSFDIIDRISGGTMGLSTPWWVEQWINEPIVARIPFLWFAINILWMILFCYGMIKAMRYFSDLGSGFLTLRVKVNAKISSDKMERFLSDKNIEVTDSLEEQYIAIKKVAWQELDRALWAGGAPPKIEITYDVQYGYLLSVLFYLDRKKSELDEDGLMRIFTATLAEHGVLEDYDPPRSKYAKVAEDVDDFQSSAFKN